MEKIARKIAQGDLSDTIKVTGQEQGAYKAMLDMSAILRQLTGNIFNSSNMLSSAAESTAAISEQTKKGSIVSIKKLSKSHRNESNG